MPDSPRRSPEPWHADKIPGGYVVRDASGQALAYVYSRETIKNRLLNSSVVVSANRTQSIRFGSSISDTTSKPSNKGRNTELGSPM
jgi:hypothetical protein